MKYTLIIGICFLLLSCANPKTKEDAAVLIERLDSLNEEQDFFQLKEEYQANKESLPESYSLFYEAIISNVFNKPDKSNETIQQLLDEQTTLNDTLLNKLHRTKLMNHINLFEYAEATETSSHILTNYLQVTDSADIGMLHNEIIIWSALKDIPKQEIIKYDDVHIPMTIDKVGLFNVDISFGAHTKNFLFDTGANISVIKRSLVEELGIRLIVADFYVTAATGAKVNADLAIADELNLNGITFKNVVFLVLEDNALAFPSIDYYINGAIGFPVIEAMEEIRIDRENKIFVPKRPVEYPYDNFAIDGLMPIIATNNAEDRLRFNFDTGATNTTLYPSFYKKYREEIDAQYEIETIESGSVGGRVQYKGYVIDSIRLSVATSEATLKNLRLHIEDIGGEESNFHGNFGQDYIKQFDEMIISFKYSSVLFR